MKTSARSFKRSSAAEPKPSLPRRFVRDDRGIAAVEFAIILPVLMTMLMGIIDWGYFFFFSETIVNAAREGARAGVVVFSSSSAAESAAQTAAEGYLTAANINLGTGWNQAAVSTSYTEPTLSVTVEMSSFEGLTGFLAPPLIPSSINYTSTMRWENAP